MPEFRMPSLGADMEAGTLAEWRVKAGDTVSRGDVVAVVETQKGAIEIEIWESGVIDSIVVPAGEKVPVGTVLANVRGTQSPSTTSTATPGPSPMSERESLRATARADASPSRTEATPHPAIRAAPAARRRARELGVDLATVRGTGSGGAVTVSDVEAATSTPGVHAPSPVVPAQAPVAPLTPVAGTDRHAAMRLAIAAAMAKSKREIPHYYLSTQIEMHTALDWLEESNRSRPVTTRVLPVTLLLKAVARAIGRHPEMNGFWIEGQFRPGPGVHIGVAISQRQGGLVAPALHDADRKTLPELMLALTDLIQRTRAGGLRSSELTDSTITVTNLGDQGVEELFGVIYPPQVAIVGFGRITERPWASNGMIGCRRAVTATLAADHRASDGHRGASFLSAIDEGLQNPGDL